MRCMGIIGGPNLFGSSILTNLTRSEIPTDHGSVTVYSRGEGTTLVVPRHGPECSVPPHRVNHRANIVALRSLGAVGIIGITSVGSLSPAIPPGTFVVPEDFIQLSDIPTFDGDNTIYASPSLDRTLRSFLVSVLTDLVLPIHHDGVYLQTRGPRFETRAEVRYFSTFADIVGMNMASEATLACEMGIPYANLSVVDNWANGINGTLTYAGFMDHVSRHMNETDRVLEALIASTPQMIPRLSSLGKNNLK